MPHRFSFSSLSPLARQFKNDFFDKLKRHGFAGVAVNRESGPQTQGQRHNGLHATPAQSGLFQRRAGSSTI